MRPALRYAVLLFGLSIGAALLGGCTVPMPVPAVVVLNVVPT